MSETQETVSKKRDKSKRMDCRKRNKSTPIKKPDVAPVNKRELKKKTRAEKRIANKNKDRESTPPEKKTRNDDNTQDKIVEPEPSASNKKEMIESEDNETNGKEKLQSESSAESNETTLQKSEKNVEDSIHKDLSLEENSSNIQILEISVIDMVQPEMEQLGDISISEIAQQIQTEGEEIELPQTDDGVCELEKEETKTNEVSSSQAMLILEQEIPDNSVDSKPDEAAAHDESLPKEAEDKNEESKTDAPCKGVDLPNQWFLDSGFPAEIVDQWKYIFRTSEPVPFDTASTSRQSE